MSFYVHKESGKLFTLNQVVRSFKDKTFPESHTEFEGFAKLVSNQPTYNILTHTLENDGYDIVGDVATEKFKVIPLPQLEIDARVVDQFYSISRHIAQKAEEQARKLGYENRHDAFMFGGNDQEITKLKKWVDDCYKLLKSKKLVFNAASGPIDIQAAIAELPVLS